MSEFKGLTPVSKVDRLTLWIVCIAAFVFLVSLNLVTLNLDVDDWDGYLSTFLIDRNSWVNDLRPPLWSYQYCAGSSRIADPGALGVSLLFAFMVLLGPIGGARVLLLVLTLIGYFSLRKLLVLFLPADSDHPLRPQAQSWVSLASALIVTGGFFTWHLLAGHFTVALIYLLFPLLHLELRLLTGAEFGRRHWILTVLWGNLFFTSGFYHGLVFFWLPVQVSLLLVVLSLRERLTLLGRAAMFQVASIMPGLYKILPVVLHHLDYPRVVVGPWDDHNKLMNLFLFQLIPSEPWRLLWGDSLATHYLPVWEQAGFSPLFWLAAVVSVCYWLRSPSRRLTDDANGAGAGLLRRFLLIYAIVSVALYLGNFASWAPLRLLNTYLFSQSVRVSDRFMINFVLLAGMLTVFVSCRMQWRPTSVFLLALGTVFAQGFALKLVQPAYVPAGTVARVVGRLAPPWSSPRRMTMMRIHSLTSPHAPMYPVLLRGEGLMNCYYGMNVGPQPTLTQIQVREMESYDRAVEGLNETTYVPLLSAPDDAPASCVSGSYFTQSRVVIDPSCPPKTRLNVNALAAGDPIGQIIEVENGLFYVNAHREGLGKVRTE